MQALKLRLEYFCSTLFALEDGVNFCDFNFFGFHCVYAPQTSSFAPKINMRNFFSLLSS